ncbi:hypothetical protein QTP86_011791 [Hemibagrus guttatus]|nr:hypothetical protein QTP86_011791 [Hemibagrus guttatus]
MYSFLILSNLVTPKENLNIVNSAISSSDSCLFLSDTVSKPYSMVGLTTVLSFFFNKAKMESSPGQDVPEPGISVTNPFSPVVGELQWINIFIKQGLLVSGPEKIREPAWKCRQISTMASATKLEFGAELEKMCWTNQEHH